MAPNEDSELPVLDSVAGSGGAPPAGGGARSAWRMAAAAMSLLFLGAIGGLYFQGPVVRAFFTVSGLEPAGGARHPIAEPFVASRVEVGPDGYTHVVALGKLVPRSGIVEVAPPTTAASPRVREVLVAEGDAVSTGDPLVVLDTYDQLVSAQGAAESAVRVAEAALAQVRRDVRTGRKESRAAVDATRAAADHASRERDRLAELHAKGAIPAAEMDRAEAAADEAAAELRRMSASAGRFADPADVRLAEEQLAAARADLERAKAELATATVVAPSDGTVLSVEVRAGERAPGGALLTLGDLRAMQAEVEVYQEDMARISVGDAVRIKSPVLGEDGLKGTVGRVGLRVGRQTLTSSDPAANTDARVVQAWIDLDEPSTAVAARYVGLEVIAHITVEDGPVAPDAGATP